MPDIHNSQFHHLLYHLHIMQRIYQKFWKQKRPLAHFMNCHLLPADSTFLYLLCTANNSTFHNLPSTADSTFIYLHYWQHISTADSTFIYLLSTADSTFIYLLLLISYFFICYLLLISYFFIVIYCWYHISLFSIYYW